MTAVAMAPAMSHNNNGIIQVVNESNLTKIESFLNDTAYREAIENSSNYNSRLCRERRLRMPFLDSQTGVAQNHSALFMSSRERLPGLLHGQIYTYPSKRWRKKRRQYLMHYLHPKRGPRGDTEDGTEGVEAVTHINDDSKDSVVLKDEHSKDAWYYDEQDMLDMDAYEEPDPDSDYDYEESYSSKRKRRKTRGGGHHPARSHPPSTDSPGGKRTKGGGRGRKKANYDTVDTDKPFVCDLCSARYKTRPGLVYHYGHSHSTSSGDPAKELSPSPAEVEPRSVADTAASNQPGGTRRGRQNATSSNTSSPSPAAPAVASAAGTASQPSQQSQQQLQPTSAQTPIAPASPTISAKEDHLPAVSSPGSTVVPSLSSAETVTGGSPTPGGGGGGGGASGGGAGGPIVEKKAGGKSSAAQPSPYCDFCLGDARENKKTGGSEELVSCSDCGRSGHPTCLQFTANMIVSVRKYRWQCIECKCCSICGTSDNDDQLLFCDDCDRGYHMYCLSPPLASPPEGSWSCRLCIAEFHRRD
ncbi:Zinc finger protein ubi-d4 A [Camponotus floridanus]|uniref:Zinc finger protein ubi-d4 A n=1 Tax=Camponotus floridanus TaxID=104421 RepID=E2AVW3_CAMFO|nr:zinc finger protein ubi-d4 A isoform X1 [Camponotus floridanus]EFN62385.1 Zinc finger protein ubi-d4 A [Camponotus floridanus]